MARWRFIGSKSAGWQKGYCLYWTNECDVASGSVGEYEDWDWIDDIPPEDATIDYGLIEEEYNGDVIYWLEDWRITQESLAALRG